MKIKKLTSVYSSYFLQQSNGHFFWIWCDAKCAALWEIPGLRVNSVLSVSRNLSPSSFFSSFIRKSKSSPSLTDTLISLRMRSFSMQKHMMNASAIHRRPKQPRVRRYNQALKLQRGVPRMIRWNPQSPAGGKYLKIISTKKYDDILFKKRSVKKEQK